MNMGKAKGLDGLGYEATNACAFWTSSTLI